MTYRRLRGFSRYEMNKEGIVRNFKTKQELKLYETDRLNSKFHFNLLNNKGIEEKVPLSKMKYLVNFESSNNSNNHHVKKGRKSHQIIVTYPDGKNKIFENVTAAANHLPFSGTPIIMVLKKKYNSYHNYKFRYATKKEVREHIF